MDVFIMVRRKKTTIFLDVKETTNVYEIKKMIYGITKVEPENQQLFYKNEELQDDKLLNYHSLNASTAKAQSPATIGLAYKEDNGLEITPLSKPPDLPDVMKPDGSGSTIPSCQNDQV